MDTTKILRGDDLMLFDSNMKSLAFATSHTLSISGNATEISCKDAGVWTGSLVNKMSWEITSENLYCVESFKNLYNLMVLRQPITIYFGQASQYSDDGTQVSAVTDEVKQEGINSPTGYWKYTTGGGGYTGKAIITSLQANANSGDNATYSVTLTGVGALELDESE